MRGIEWRTRSLHALFACLALAGCSQRGATPRQLPPPAVTVARPAVVPITPFHEYTGETDAVESVDIRARVRGFLTKIDYQEGTEVKAGTLLYEIDPREFEAALERAEAQVLQARSQVTLAQAELQRTTRLRASNAVTEEEYQQRVATVQQAEATLLQGQAAVDLARLDLSYAKIATPINGRVGRTLITVGNLVGVNEPTLLTTVVRLDPIYVYFNVPEKNFLDYQKRVQQGSAATAEQREVPVFVSLENEQGFPHKGIIDFRESRVDPMTGTVTVRGVLPNPDRMIAPGMFVRIRVPIGQPQDQLLVPQVAVAADQRGEYVLVVKSDNTVEVRPVKTGEMEGEDIVIQSGITVNDWIVVNGTQKARPGRKVAPKQTKMQVAAQRPLGQLESGQTQPPQKAAPTVAPPPATPAVTPQATQKPPAESNTARPKRREELR
jgi:RND family efflux transporter MFP subunit